MTDNEIEKALENCIKNKYDHECHGCPYDEECHCVTKMHKDLLKLINRQRKEIERLKVIVEKTGTDVP